MITIRKGLISIMDVFKEQVVEKEPTKRDKMLDALVKFSAFALAFSLILGSLAFLPKTSPLAVFLGGAAVWLSFRLAKNLNIEYEYAFTNGELDVDKIIAKSKRKRLCSVHINNITSIGIWNDDMEVDADRTIVLASDNRLGVPEYYMEFVYKDYGNTILFFSPDREMIDLMMPYIPRELRRDFQELIH
jgi:hypothetical protein